MRFKAKERVSPDRRRRRRFMKRLPDRRAVAAALVAEVGPLDHQHLRDAGFRIDPRLRAVRPAVAVRARRQRRGEALRLANDAEAEAPRVARREARLYIAAEDRCHLFHRLG